MFQFHPTHRRTLFNVALPGFLAGFLAVQIYGHRDALILLTFDSFLSRQRAMTSAQSGPDRYYVLHEPGAPLADAARADPAILAVEPTSLDGLTGIDVAPGNAASIATIRALDGVHYAIRSNIPLFCH